MTRSGEGHAHAGIKPTVESRFEAKRIKVDTVGIDFHPMHGDVGLGKLGEKRMKVPPGPSGKRDDHVGGSRAVDQLVEGIEPAQDRNRVDSGMNCQMAAAEPRLRRVVVAGVDEPDDGHAPAGTFVQLPEQFPGVAAGTDHDDPVLRSSPDQSRLCTPRELQGIFHEWHRSIGQTAEEPCQSARSRQGSDFIESRGTIRGVHVVQPISFKLFHRSDRRNIPLNSLNRQDSSGFPCQNPSIFTAARASDHLFGEPERPLFRFFQTIWIRTRIRE